MVGVSDKSQLAYSLWRKGRGWSWGVYDAQGERVAEGAADSRTDAELAIAEVYRQEELSHRAA